MEEWFLVIVILFLIPLSTAEVFHDLEISESEVRNNMSLKLTCNEDCPVTRWSVQMSLPESSEILDVKSSAGNVEDYILRGEDFTVKTETSPVESEKITVNYLQTGNSRELYGGLVVSTLSLSAFDGEKNSGEIEGDIIHASLTPDFDFSAVENSMNFSGQGPVNIYVVMGDGYETEYFEFFGEEPENTSISYEVPVGVLGFSSKFERLPVSIKPPETYNRTVNRWSAGQYVNATLVTRDNLEEDFRPILSHETVHALNDQYLDWDTRSSWFDEGISRYVEYLTKRALEGETKTRNLFWEEKTYTKFEEGSRYRYTVPSKSNKEALWNYYQNDREFMKNWRPEQANREFGYAYSELVIRNYVMRNGSIKDLYTKLGSKIDSDEEKWEKLSKHMDLTPCKYDSRDIFEECLEKINEYDYPVYRADNVTDNEEKLVVEKVKLEERKKSDRDGLLNRSEPENGSSESFRVGRIIRDFIVKLIQGL